MSNKLNMFWLKELSLCISKVGGLNCA